MDSKQESIPSPKPTEKPDVAQANGTADTSVKPTSGADRTTYRKDRPSPYPRGGRNAGPRPSNSSRLPPYNRVFLHNIAYEERWQTLKDTFRNEVGEVTYVELFTDESGKSRGYGVVEFKSKELCELAVKKMNRYEFNNRKIVVRLDYDGELCRKALMRDRHPAAMRMNGPPMPGLPPPMPGPLGPLPPMPPPMGHGGMGLPSMPSLANDVMGGISQSGPIGKTVFVANLDYKVTYSKLKEVFQLAGRVVKVDLMLDKDNKSRGMATVTFDEPFEAAQAISMLNNQKLYDRTMIVKMDKDNFRDKPSGGDLPSGLSGIGPSLNKRNRDPMSGMGSGGGYGDTAGLGSSLGALSSNTLALSSLAAMSRGLPELSKQNPPQANFAASLSALTQQANRISETLQSSNSAGLGLGSLGALSGLSELAKMGLGRPSGRSDPLDQRIMDEQRARLLAATQPTGFSDRERIEMDIARVDNRIRDIDRSMAATERGRTVGSSPSLPPMPPPMSAGTRIPGTVVFVRNLPYTLTWQTLRDKFSRCGRVLFAEIKMDNGKSRGFGNVRFETPEQAQQAVRHLDGMDIDGRKIAVHIDNRN